jgi:hypothetical protein
MGLVSKNLPQLDNASARIKSLFILASFATVVLMIASFSEGKMGGHCEEGESIPNIQTLMLWIQIGVHGYVIFEYFCGYGAIDFESTDSREP